MQPTHQISRDIRRSTRAAVAVAVIALSVLGLLCASAQGQHIITRADGYLEAKHYTAGPDLEKQVVPAIIATEGYGTPIAQWEAGTTKPGHGPAMLKPELRNVTVIGRGVNGRPSGNVGIPERFHGVLMNGSGGLVENLHAHNIPGTAGEFYRPNNERDGQITVNDRTEFSLRRLYASRVFRGFDIGCVDGVAHDITVQDFRDYGIRIGHSIDYSALHAHGGIGPAILLAGNRGRGRGIVGENAGYGLKVDGNGHVVFGVRAFTNKTAGVLISGKRNQLYGLDIDADTCTGIHVTNQFNTLSGFVEAKGKTAQTCVVLDNGTGQRIDLALSMKDGCKGLVATVPVKDNTRIELAIDGGQLGADFSPGIGPGCDIHVRTRGTVEAVRTTTIHPSSTVTVNGEVRK